MIRSADFEPIGDLVAYKYSLIFPSGLGKPLPNDNRTFNLNDELQAFQIIAIGTGFTGVTNLPPCAPNY